MQKAVTIKQASLTISYLQVTSRQWTTLRFDRKHTFRTNINVSHESPVVGGR